MISVPRVFHRIWLGSQPMPPIFERWGQSWLAHHPGWTLRTWEDADVAGLCSDDPELRAQLARCPNHSQKSNVLRYKIVSRLGGVYIDTDFQCLRSIEPLIEGADLFAAWQKKDRKNPTALAPGFFGAVPRHPFTSALVAGIARLDLEQFRTTGPRYFTAVATDHLSGMRVFDKTLFYPYDWNELHRAHDRYQDAYAVHHWAGKWYRGSFGGAEPLVPSPWEREFSGDRISVVTCSERTRYLLDTLVAIDEEGGGDVLRTVYSDGPCSAEIRVQVPSAWSLIEKEDGPSGTRHMMWWIFVRELALGVERLLYFEDDIALAPRAVTRMRACEVADDHAMTTFYDWKEFPDPSTRHGYYTVPSLGRDDLGICGSQALMIPRQILEWVVSKPPDAWGNFTGRHASDYMLSLALSQSAQPRHHVHLPSLVDHLGHESVVDPSRSIVPGRRRAAIFPWRSR